MTPLESTGAQRMTTPMVKNIRFGDACNCLERGMRVARACWSSNTWVHFMQQAVLGFGNALPVFVVMSDDGAASIWQPSAEDCMATDWMVS